MAITSAYQFQNPAFHIVFARQGCWDERTSLTQHLYKIYIFIIISLYVLVLPEKCGGRTEKSDRRGQVINTAGLCVRRRYHQIQEGNCKLRQRFGMWLLSVKSVKSFYSQAIYEKFIVHKNLNFHIFFVSYGIYSY